MVNTVTVIEYVVSLLMFASVLLYIHCQVVLYRMIKRGTKEKLTSYLYILYFCGFVDLLIIANTVFFQMLPSLVWQPFFYSLGPVGARTYFMLAFGCELLVIICEAYIAATRYLTFVRNSLNTNYWEIRKINQWLLIMIVICAAYASSYFFCEFVTSLDAEKTSARFLFSKSSLDWVTVSIFVLFIVATGSFLCCLFCYWKVTTIIRGSQSGLTRSTAMRMCLTSAIISFGAFLSLLVRITNHISYRAGGYDLIPYTVYFLLVRVGTLIATCGNPWIVMVLFTSVRENAFPCWRSRAIKPMPVMSITDANAS